MNKKRQKRISKFLSYVLRHHPESIGIELDSGGWANVAELLQAIEHNGLRITLDELRTVVEENDKQRFSFSEDGLRIRANQGHSIPVELGYNQIVPPEVLYHGTARRLLFHSLPFSHINPQMVRQFLYYAQAILRPIVARSAPFN